MDNRQEGTDNRTDKWKDRQADRWMNIRQAETDNRQKDGQTDREKGRQMNMRQAETHDRQTRWADRWRDRQTDEHKAS